MHRPVPCRGDSFNNSSSCARSQGRVRHCGFMRFDNRRAERYGFTLVEVLVAMAVTLLLMGIVVTIFGSIGDNVAKHNASMELSDQLRSVKQRLQLDLAGATTQMLPPRRPENGEGYFEIIEGPVGRLPPNTEPVLDEAGVLGPDTTVGDNDDILMLTTRSKGEMFQGRGALYNPATSSYSVSILQSQVAEVVWFIRGTTLYRRQLLVRPDLPTRPDSTNPNSQYAIPQPNSASAPYYTTPLYPYATNFYSLCDLSARAAGLGYDLSPSPPAFFTAANSLEDLTKRENRFAHRPVVSGTSPFGWPHDVRGWGIFYSTSPFGSSALASLPSQPVPIATSGRLGLPTLQECTSPYWPLPGTIDISTVMDQNSAQLYLRADNGAVPTPDLKPKPAVEQFDAWVRPNPPWYSHQWNKGNSAASADPLTGAMTNYFPPNIQNQSASPAPYGSRYGEDIILTNVLSFDVRVWDPTAQLISVTDATTTAVFSPGDPGYAKAVVDYALGLPPPRSFSVVGQGAYVDLYYSSAVMNYLQLAGAPFSGLSAAQQSALKPLLFSHFAGPGNAKSGLAAFSGTGLAGIPTPPYTYTNEDPYCAVIYDTGSWHYEVDGIDQDNDGIVDRGTNGIDDNGDGVVDDVNELEAPPPYPFALRGVQIKIRCFDPDSKEIREVTVVQEFVPE